MASSSFAKFFSLFSLLFTCLSWAQTLPPGVNDRKEPQGPLKIAVDWSLLNYDGNFWQNDRSQVNVMCSAHLTFKKPVSELFTDGQLWKMAKDAYDEMMIELDQYGIAIDPAYPLNHKKNMQRQRWRPNAMGIMAWGNEIILASSQKGQWFSVGAKTWTPVRDDLEACQKANWDSVKPPGNDDKGPEHRTKGSCAEEMLAHQYYLAHGADRDTIKARTPIRDLNPQAVLATWVRSATEDYPSHTSPCDPEKKGEWGCKTFVGTGKGGQNFRVIENTEADQDYTMPSDVLIDQIELCGNRRTFM
ncbi:hypothetical protein QBC38DRAFT_519445 [Podospora fimiseda]|uniref:Uncharacterized protein n=1 Tax=Podospora fimiseda TaxID=252190 RepID=A0AAN6YPI4_9PEZI|nr:hypothetical protein QBC38DRAFT_519445 [Podospora fimiseda]